MCVCVYVCLKPTGSLRYWQNVYGLGKRSRAVKVCEWGIEIKHRVSCLCVQWNRKASGFLRVSVRACCTGLDLFFFFDRKYVWWRQRIHPHSADEGNKILQTTEKGEKGKQRGGGILKWSESGLKPTNPLTVTSERQTQHVETNNVAWWSRRWTDTIKYRNTKVYMHHQFSTLRHTKLSWTHNTLLWYTY